MDLGEELKYKIADHPKRKSQWTVIGPYPYRYKRYNPNSPGSPFKVIYFVTSSLILKAMHHHEKLKHR